MSFRKEIARFEVFMEHFLRLVEAAVAAVSKASLSTRVFETRTATGRENFACQDSGVSHFLYLSFLMEKRH